MELVEYSQEKHLLLLRQFSGGLSWVSHTESKMCSMAGLTSNDIGAVVNHSVLVSTQVYALVDKGRMLALGGYSITVDATGAPVGCQWLLTHKDLVFTTKLLKQLKALVDLWIMRYPHLIWYNRALSSHAPTIRWLKFFGFTLGRTDGPWVTFYRLPEKEVNLCAIQ